MRTAFVITATVVVLAGAQAPAPAPDTCRELVLYGGKIATMDARMTTATSIVIRDDRIAGVSAAAGIPPHNACARLINLRGRLVIPGMIDTHDHVSYFTARPGYDVRLDTAASIADVQGMIRTRAATVAKGAWVTSLGGWGVTHLAEKRMPTGAELDVAAPEHPVLLLMAGQGVTNARGRAWLSAHQVTVGDNGALAGPESIAALNALRATMTFEDQKRTISDLLAYYSSLGVTTHIDNGGPRPPAPALAKVSRMSDGGLNTLDPVTGYLPQLALDREGRLPGRLRVLFYSFDLTPELPLLRSRLDNQMMGFGSDWFRVAGVGERVGGGDGAGDAEWDANGRPAPQYEAAVRLVAQRGWTLQQHSTALEDEKRHVDLWERVNAEVPLAPLRWTLAHVRGIDRATLDRLKAIGVGVSITGTRYMSEGDRPGPPIRTIVASGIRASYGSDNPSAPPTNPWLHMYAIVTGRNYANRLIEGDETLSRIEALRLYTISGAWFSRDEDRLGSIEAGKLADVVVLSDDFLDPARVPDDAIKRLRSVLTIVGGRIVRDSGDLK
jgi:predicted amidohydrolase YtcJ